MTDGMVAPALSAVSESLASYSRNLTAGLSAAVLGNAEFDARMSTASKAVAHMSEGLTAAALKAAMPTTEMSALLAMPKITPRMLDLPKVDPVTFDFSDVAARRTERDAERDSVQVQTRDAVQQLADHFGEMVVVLRGIHRIGVRTFWVTTAVLVLTAALVCATAVLIVLTVHG